MHRGAVKSRRRAPLRHRRPPHSEIFFFGKGILEIARFNDRNGAPLRALRRCAQFDIRETMNWPKARLAHARGAAAAVGSADLGPPHAANIIFLRSKIT